MRSDLDIREDVLDELAFDPRVHEAGIGVSVEDGVVTLTGHVPTYADRFAAEKAVQRVKGVRAIAQDMQVNLGNEERADDSELALRIANVLRWSVIPPKDGVKVRVDNAWVTLHGEVNHAFQRQDAERCVRGLSGIKGVTNLVTVRNLSTPRDIQAAIRKAFQRNAEVDAEAVKVAVDGGKVTLTGKVQSWAERMAAEHAAWQTIGVAEVVDHLSVG